MELTSLLVSSALALASTPATTVWAVGDGGVPGGEDDAVAARIEQEGLDHLLYLGDVYETGTREEFAKNYGSSFGRFKSITSPTPGNHEWGNRAEGYDPYWGPRVRQPGGGHHYSFELGRWHAVSLNSEDPDSIPSQRAWLRADLARYAGTCTLAFWHRPRYNAGEHGEAPELEPLYELLEGRAVIVLTGHDHNYQRFRPWRGISHFIVGTGGRQRYDVNGSDPRLAASSDSAFGALRLELEPSNARFEFVRTDGRRLDSGSVACRKHGPRLRITRPRSGVTYRRGLRTLTGTARGVDGPVRATLARSGGGRSSYTVSGRSSWRLTLPKGLGRGSYRLSVRARDGGGRPGATKVSFRVR
jgi:hypothetical protein